MHELLFSTLISKGLLLSEFFLFLPLRGESSPFLPLTFFFSSILHLILMAICPQGGMQSLNYCKGSVVYLLLSMLVVCDY